MADTTGQADLRAENVSAIVNGFALADYRFKDLVMVQSSNAWKESYYQENAADLTGGTDAAVSGVPRLAQFPNGEVGWTLKNSWIVKHGMEGVISYEDKLTNNIDVIARTLLRISRAVVKSVDTSIYNVLSENNTPSLINTVAITADYEWDSATIANRDPIQNVLDSMRAIAEDNYNIYSGNGFMVVSPKDLANLLGNANVRNAGQFYTDAVTKNGKVGRLCGLDVIVSNNITADKCLIGVKKECGTFKQSVPLTVQTIENPGIDYKIRAWELGITQLTNPSALCLLTNTQKT
jgi:hypothetical protein